LMGEIVKTLSNPMEDFQTRVLKKVREDIGKMLPDEVVESLVQRAIDEQFFQPRKVYRSYGGHDEEPSWFIKEVTRLSKPLIESYVAAHIKEHEPAIKKAVEQFLSTQSLTLLTIAALQQTTRQDIFELAELIVRGIKGP